MSLITLELSQVKPARRWALPNEGSRRAEGKIKSGDWWAFTLYIGDLIRWRGLWSGREFHRSLAGMEGEKSEAEKIKKEIKDRERGQGRVVLRGSPSLLPRLNCLNSIPFTSFVCF